MYVGYLGQIPRVIFQNSPKYHEMPRRVIFGSFEISPAGIYPKYPEETVLIFVYTTGQRNLAFYVTHIFLFSHAQLIGFTTTCDLNM